jgi:threonine/homoserine/homoserine lactone efflux protein
MVDVAVLPGFVVVILLFLVPPGPDMAYMLAVGLAGGRGAAVKAILGIGTTVRGARRSPSGSSEVTAARPYVRGLLVSLTNPKVILFYLAVLPQFMGNAQHTELQLALLGAVSVGMEVLLYGAIGVGAGAFHTRFSESHRAGAVLHHIAAAVYLVLAVVILAEAVITST